MGNMTDKDFIDLSKPSISDGTELFKKNPAQRLIEMNEQYQRIKAQVGEYQPLIDKIEVSDKSLIMKILWMIVTSPIKTITYIYYFVKLITGAKAMWETIKLMFGANWKTTVAGIFTAIAIPLYDYLATGQLFADPDHVGLSLLALVVGVLMPDMGWLKKIIQDLAEKAKNK